MKAKKKPRHAKIISYLSKPRNNDPCRIGSFVTIKGKHASWSALYYFWYRKHR